MKAPTLTDRPTPRLLTAGQIAVKLGVPFHRVRYVIKARDIQPAAWSGNARVFDREALALIRQSLNGIDARRSRRPDDLDLANSTLFDLGEDDAA